MSKIVRMHYVKHKSIWRAKLLVLIIQNIPVIGEAEHVCGFIIFVYCFFTFKI